MPLNMRCALSTIRPDVISVISIQAGEIFELQLQKIPIEQRGKNCCFRKIITRKGITLFEVHCVLVCRLRNRGSELQLKCVKGKMLVFFFFLFSNLEKTVTFPGYFIDALERLSPEDHVQNKRCLHTFS